MIALQYCDGFCHISTWIRYRYTCVPSILTPLPPPSPLHLSGLSQSTNFMCPASCIELALVICLIYGNVHVSVVFCQTIPLSASPSESKSVLYIRVSFAALNVVSLIPSF